MEKLKNLRLSRKLTQEKIASILGIARTTYTQYETGASEPDFKMLKKIADYFNVSIDYLLENESNIVSDKELDGVEFALYGEVKELSENQKQDVLTFVRFIKEQEEKKKGN